MNEDCIFCKINAGLAPAKIVFQDEGITAFYDSRPIAPVHILVVPNEHLDSINGIRPEHDALLGRMVRVARELAARFSIEESGYRLVFNTGPDAGQSVFHVHLHLIGGRHMPFKFE